MLSFAFKQNENDKDDNEARHTKRYIKKIKLFVREMKKQVLGTVRILIFSIHDDDELFSITVALSFGDGCL